MELRREFYQDIIRVYKRYLRRWTLYWRSGKIVDFTVSTRGYFSLLGRRHYPGSSPAICDSPNRKWCSNIPKEYNPRRLSSRRSSFSPKPCQFFPNLPVPLYCFAHNRRYASMKCAISLMLEKTHSYRKYAKILVDMHEDCMSLPNLTMVLCSAKSLGHFSPYGSYWASLSLINDHVDPDFVEKFISHVERWSRVHAPLRPRMLHLRAEILSEKSPAEEPQTLLALLIIGRKTFWPSCRWGRKALYLRLRCFHQRTVVNILIILILVSCAEMLRKAFGPSSSIHTGYSIFNPLSDFSYFIAASALYRQWGCGYKARKTFKEANAYKVELTPVPSRPSTPRKRSSSHSTSGNANIWIGVHDSRGLWGRQIRLTSRTPVYTFPSSTNWKNGFGYVIWLYWGFKRWLLTGPTNLTQRPLLGNLLQVWRNPQVRRIPFGLTAGADYVAMIIPHQGELVVEATFAASSKDVLTLRCVNGNVEFHDKEPLTDGRLV